MALFDELRARRIELGFAQNIRGFFQKAQVELLFEADRHAREGAQISLLRLIR
jgi:hypothetical protein